jgi:hypothetical protein
VRLQHQFPQVIGGVVWLYGCIIRWPGVEWADVIADGGVCVCGNLSGCVFCQCLVDVWQVRSEPVLTGRSMRV